MDQECCLLPPVYHIDEVIRLPHIKWWGRKAIIHCGFVCWSLPKATRSGQVSTHAFSHKLLNIRQTNSLKSTFVPQYCKCYLLESTPVPLTCTCHTPAGAPVIPADLWCHLFWHQNEGSFLSTIAIKKLNLYKLH